MSGRGCRKERVNRNEQPQETLDRKHAARYLEVASPSRASPNSAPLGQLMVQNNARASESIHTPREILITQYLRPT